LKGTIMEKKLLLVVVMLTVVALTTSSALALAPMGPPTAGLNKGEWRVGVDYAYSEMDLKATLSDDITELADDYGIDITDNSGTIKDVKVNTIAANIGYGLTDNWEAFVRLGGANAKWEEEDIIDYSGSGFLGGFGTKITWAKQGNLSWGTMAQVNWLNFKDTLTGTVDDEDYDVDIEIEAYEFQIAFGPTWKVSDALSFYGGPFLHFFNGDVEASADGESLSLGDLEQKSEFGGYVGAQLDIKPGPDQVSNGCFLFGEGQFTGDGWALGTGIGWKF
jgi:hypothetical protein